MNKAGEENVTICRDLLRWGGGPSLSDAHQHTMCWSDGRRHHSTPSFDDWASAGLILHALQIHTIGFLPDVRVAAAVPIIDELSRRLTARLLGPPAIRSLALEYLRAVSALGEA